MNAMPSVAFTAGGHWYGYLLSSLFNKDGTVLTWSARITRNSSGDEIATHAKCNNAMLTTQNTKGCHTVISHYSITCRLVRPDTFNSLSLRHCQSLPTTPTTLLVR